MLISYAAANVLGRANQCVNCLEAGFRPPPSQVILDDDDDDDDNNDKGF